MKRLLLLTLAAIPLLAYSGNFVYYDYDYYDDDYWYDEYWEDGYWCDGYWEHYPHGYYCVYYVWWYPWWWDVFWWRCHWCHHFSWDFFYCGFYIVWFDDGCWWFRPRYGRWVRYRLPYSYGEIYQRAMKHGVYLPKKSPREIDIPYKGEKIMQLTKERDPELFQRVQKEHKTGSLEKMRKNFMTDMKKEITKKNQEYRIKNNDVRQPRSIEQNKQGERISPRQTSTSKRTQQVPQYQTEKKQSQKDSQSRIIREKRNKSSEAEKKRNESTRMKQEDTKKPVPRDYYKESPRNNEDRRGAPVDKRTMSSRSSKYKE